MIKDFFLNFIYDNKTCIIRVENPAEPLNLLMYRIKNANVFDIPDSDSMGAPILSFFLKPEDDGPGIILHEKDEYGLDLSLLDYDIKSGETLFICQEIILQ